MIVAIESKSITLLHRCVLITFLFVAIGILMKGVDAQEKVEEILADLPRKQDIGIYIDALEKAVDFCSTYKFYVDLNLEFGLFLINVNLRDTIETKKDSLPPKWYKRLENIVAKNSEVEDYFQNMVHGMNDDLEATKLRTVTKLFRNDTLWQSNLPKFNTKLLNQTKLYSPEDLINKYGRWEYYVFGVYDFAHVKPVPKDSDACIASLAQTPPTLHRRDIQSACITLPDCKEAVKGGDEYGYGLTHRILFMSIARYSRGCIIYSEMEDKSKLDEFCKMAFTEAQYIALNTYQLPDLMLEQMALCGLSGHAQFNRRSWLRNLLAYQSSHGCFKISLLPDKRVNSGDIEKTWKIMNTDPHDVLNGQCHSHMTAVAAGALSSAVKYILDIYDD